MISAPLARTSSGLTALTVAAVPTGMKAGVRIVPRRIAMVPVRALPSVAEMVKSKRGDMAGLLASPRGGCRHASRTRPMRWPVMADERDEALRAMALHRGLKLRKSRRRKPGGDF